MKDPTSLIPGPYRGALATAALVLGLDRVDDQTMNALMLGVYALGALWELWRRRRRPPAASATLPAIALCALFGGCAAPLVSVAQVCVDDGCVSAELVVHRGELDVRVLDVDIDVDVEAGLWVVHRSAHGHGWVRVRDGDATAGVCGYVPVLGTQCAGDVPAPDD